MKKRGLFSRIAALSMAAILAAAPVSTVFADQTTTPAITSVDFKKLLLQILNHISRMLLLHLQLSLMLVIHLKRLLQRQV